MKSAIYLILLVLGDVAVCDGSIWPPASTRATHYFAGTVAELEQRPDRPQFNLATVIVREVWRGDIADTVTVMTESDRCGAWLERGDDCVFLATVPDRPDSGMARHLYVTEGACELYIHCSPPLRLTWGVPIRVANGQTSRVPMLDDVIAILTGDCGGDPEYAARLLEASTAYIRDLARSPEAADRHRFDQAMANIVRALMDAYGQPGDAYDYLLRTIERLGPAACAAVPVMLAFQHEVGADELGTRYFHAVLGAVGYGPEVQLRMAKVLASTKSPEMREFVLTMTWQGPYGRSRENPPPAQFVSDPDQRVRIAAIMALTSRTADDDSLVALAHLVLGDRESYVTEQCLPYLISSLDDNRALGVALIGLEHPDELVAFRAFWAATRGKRSRDTRCAVLKVALKSQHWFVRQSAQEYLAGDGADCE